MSLFHTFRHLFHPQRSNNHRPKILHPDALFVLVALVFSSWLVLYPTHFLNNSLGMVLGFASNITADDVIRQTNQERAKQGLPPLKANAALSQGALAKAQNMFSQQYWAHVSPNGTQPWQFFQDAHYKYSVAGENLARDFSQTTDMIAAWMASPTHRKNILDARYQEIGIAVVDGTLLGEQTTLVVQFFGTPMTGQAQIDTAGQKTIAKPAPAARPAEITFAEPTQPFTRQEVLASTVMPITQLRTPILFSPLQISKIFFLAIILLISGTLIYDSFIMNHRNTVRLVGKNFAHLTLLLVTAFLLLLFKGGVVG